eukprot:2652457-Amphidinium_carterae.1
MSAALCTPLDILAGRSMIPTNFLSVHMTLTTRFVHQCYFAFVRLSLLQWQPARGRHLHPSFALGSSGKGCDPLFSHCREWSRRCVVMHKHVLSMTLADTSKGSVLTEASHFPPKTYSRCHSCCLRGQLATGRTIPAANTMID